MFQSSVFKNAALCAIILWVASLTGCASIVSGTTQVISVETLQKSGPVSGASCRLENDKGVYYVTSPGTVSVHRAYGDMTVKCEKESLPDGVAVVKSATKGMAAGNILFGGIIGIGVDAASGAAYDYPNLFQVMMGETLSIPVVASTQKLNPSAP